MRLILLFCLQQLLWHPSLPAQIKPAGITKEPFNAKGIYRFPAFTAGTVAFRNGNTASGKFNYNIALDEMHFVTPKGDTLSIEDPAIIKLIRIGENQFYYDNGYLQALTITGDMVLAFRQVIKTQEKKESVYGMTTEKSMTKTYNFFSQNGIQYNLGGDEMLLFNAREYYFFGDQYGHFFKANKDDVLQHYRKHESAVKEFLTTNHISFNNPEDLVKLAGYCSQLTL